MMETIFDYNPTIAELGRFNVNRRTIKMFKTSIIKCNDDRLYTLGLLFSMRGDNKKANEYWNQIEEKSILRTLIQDF